jgi:hypothetical protein
MRLPCAVILAAILQNITVDGVLLHFKSRIYLQTRRVSSSDRGSVWLCKDCIDCLTGVDPTLNILCVLIKYYALLHIHMYIVLPSTIAEA